MKTSVKILLGIIIALALAVLFLGRNNRSLRSDNNRLQGNNEALMEDVATYLDMADRSAASVQMLELEKGELEKHYQDVCQRAKDLGLQVKRLQAASKTETQTKVEIQTVVKDSIVYRNGVLDSLKHIEWRDPWVEVEGTLKKDSLDLNITSVDTLYQFVHRVPHKFWFIKWGTKAIRQEITSSNPHTKIIYTEYIELKKKK